MKSGTLFVTGTDTGVGKTRVACALIRQARSEGIKVFGWKPVATGCLQTPSGLRNDDALALQAAAGTDEPYELLNPYAFEPAIAPHLAAKLAKKQIRTQKLDRVHRELKTRYDLIVCEGAGGWRVPLGETWTFGAWAAEHEWPVLMVVGMRLGCLNHAMLTAESISRDAPLAGWVANVLPPAMPMLEENIATLKEKITAPSWGRIACDAESFAEPGDYSSGSGSMMWSTERGSASS
jgi:dethiobiotin synthetase